MATAILKWIRRRGMRAKTYPAKYGAFGDKLKTGGRGKIERKDLRIKKMVDSATSYKAMAYAVATNIKKKGIKPTGFFSKAIVATRKEQKAKYAKAFKLDIIESLNQLN